jgi:ribonuclease HI
MAEPHRRYVVYADGACIGNPGPGGWGVVIAEPADAHREWNGGPYPRTTNNRMEIMAAVEGLKALPPGALVTLRTDSQYVVNTMMKGWKRSANLDLWSDLDREASARRVSFEWVPGHAGNHWNERADRLARAAAEGKTPASQSGTAPTPSKPCEDDAARELEPSLRPGESIRPCAQCGHLFVSSSAGETCCSLVTCQLRARPKS